MDSILEINDLRVKRNGKDVLKGFNLIVGSGEGIIITGENGAGKTTLLKSIAGLLPYQSGTIKINQKSKHDLAYVPQEESSHEFPITVWEMVELGTSGMNLNKLNRLKRIKHALKSCSCDHLISRPYYKLSGGEKRRVSLARCLAQDAKILLLDEPLTFLDKTNRGQFIDLLEEIRKLCNIAIIVVTHTDNSRFNDNWRVLDMEILC